ncbi:hypothetical protein D3C81_2221540 [compost metagenome]
MNRPMVSPGCGLPRFGEYGGALLTNGMARNSRCAHAAMLNGARSRPMGDHCRPPFQWASMSNKGNPLLRS